MKHLFKFFNKRDVPWVELIWDSYYHSSPPQVTQLCGSFWGRDILKLYDKFCLFVTPQVHAGDTVVFWLDRWQIDNRVIALKDRFPRLHSFAIDDMISVKNFFDYQSMVEGFHLPFSSEAYLELSQLQALLQPISLDPNEKDIWKWPSKSGEFQSKL